MYGRGVRAGGVKGRCPHRQHSAQCSDGHEVGTMMRVSITVHCGCVDVHIATGAAYACQLLLPILPIYVYSFGVPESFTVFEFLS